MLDRTALDKLGCRYTTHDHEYQGVNFRITTILTDFGDFEFCESDEYQTVVTVLSPDVDSLALLASFMSIN